MDNNTNNEFHKFGIVKLRKAIDMHWVKLLQEGCEKAIQNPGPFSMQYSKDPDKNYFADSFIWDKISEFKEFIFHSNIAQIVSQLMGGDDVYLFFDHLLVKEPFSATATPWHQDLPYWPLEGGKILTTWIPLDDVDDSSGRMEYIVDPNICAQLYKPRNFANDNRYEKKPYPEIPDFEANRGKYNILSFDTDKGDILVFNERVVHGSKGNTSSVRRRALSVRWVNKEVSFTGDPITIKIPQNHGLKPGDKLKDSSIFPKVWPS